MEIEPPGASSGSQGGVQPELHLTTGVEQSERVHLNKRFHTEVEQSGDTGASNSEAPRVPETSADPTAESPEEMLFHRPPFGSEEDWQLLSDLPAALEERRRLRRFEVFEEISEQDHVGEVIQTRSVDVAKHGAVRSRIVGTPDATCFRLLMSELAQSRDRVAVIVDAVSAFLQAESSEGYVLCAPKSVRKLGMFWRLLKALPGLRKSGSGKTTKQTTWTLEGFTEA
eukprot:2541833-Amphidinium_carterae.1